MVASRGNRQRRGRCFRCGEAQTKNEVQRLIRSGSTSDGGHVLSDVAGSDSIDNGPGDVADLCSAKLIGNRQVNDFAACLMSVWEVPRPAEINRKWKQGPRVRVAVPQLFDDRFSRC